MLHPFFRLIAFLLVILLIAAFISGCAPKAAPAPAFNVEEALSRAELLFAQGNYEETMLALTAVIEMEPANVKGYLRLSDVYIARGEKDKALELLKKGLDLTGSDEIADRIKGMTDEIRYVSNIFMGRTAAFLVKNEGSVYATGENSQGQLGNGSNKSTTVFTKIEELHNVARVIPDIPFGGSAAITQTGDLYIWATYMLPDKKIETLSATPQKLMSGVKSVAVGGAHVLLLKTDGTLYSWGYNGNGALGQGRPIAEKNAGGYSFSRFGMDDYYTIEKVMEHVKEIAASLDMSFAVADDNVLYGWGMNLSEYQLAIQENKDRTCYNTPQKLCAGIQSIAATETDLCAVDLSGDLHIIAGAEIFNGPIELASPVLHNVEKVVTGSSHYLALTNDNKLFGAGSNRSGQLAQDPHVVQGVPLDMPIILIELPTTEIAAGGESSMAVTVNGDLFTWGENQSGQLGNGRKGVQHDRAEYNWVMDEVTAVFGGANRFFALRQTGDLFAWGWGTLYELGTQKAENQKEPVKVCENIRSACSNSSMTFAITNNNELLACGQFSEIGYGNGTEGTTLTSFTKIMDGVRLAFLGNGDNAFIIKADDSLWGWGLNMHGNLGTGTKTQDENMRYSNLVLTPIKIMDHVKSVATSERVTFILTNAGEVYECGISFWNDEADPPTKITDGISQIAATNQACFMLKESGELLGYGDLQTIFSHLGEKRLYTIIQNICRLSNGGCDCLLAVDEEGRAYQFGWDVKQSLTEEEKTEFLNLPDKALYKFVLDHIKDVAVSTGGSKSTYVALTKQGEVYSWGDNEYGQLGLGDAGTDENIFEIKLPE